MSLSFVERLSKIKKPQNTDIPVRKPRASIEKHETTLGRKRATEFEQHHSDLKSMLRMLECDKDNSFFCTPCKSKDRESQKKFFEKAKTEGQSSKENSKKMELAHSGPERKLKIRFKNSEEEPIFNDSFGQTLLLKNLQYKNKTSRPQE